MPNPRQNNTIYLKDYQAPNFIVNSLHLSIDLFDFHATVTSEIDLTRTHPGALELIGDGLTLVSAMADGRVLTSADYRLDGDNFVWDECPGDTKLTLVTKIYPQNNKALSGLYRSNQMFCTQCEAEGFRRITYFFDRPDVLTVFTTKISADKSNFPVLLSNGNLVDTGELDNGRHYATWHDPFKKPSYLFALVAGDLAHISDTFTTQSGREVALKIYVEHGNEDKCDHAMISLKKSMRWDEEVYGREYDLDIFMIVAVSDFNMGAMENKGLNIFNSKYILASSKTATDTDFAGIESVVAHEYFHNWSGNRVTCRDWFQLSLKEGFTVFRDQEFSRDMNSREVNRIMDVKSLRAIQFPEDAGKLAHAVRPESYEEINNFYTATIYEKGAEVIRMQHTLLGAEGFRRGTDLYFSRHDGQAVTIDDFVKAMEDANQVDLTQFKRWYSQAGTPEVTVVTNFNEGTFSVTLTQYCRPTAECQHKLPFVIPISVAFFDESGEQLSDLPSLLVLKEQSHTFSWTGLKKAPIISMNRGFSAPIKLDMPTTMERELFLLAHETDGVAKWEAQLRLALMVLKSWKNKPESEWRIDAKVLEAYQSVLLDTRLDSALKAEVLTIPSFEDLGQTQELIDVDWVEASRKHYRVQLGQFLKTDLIKTYEMLQARNTDATENAYYGDRALKSLCLALLVKSDSAHLPMAKAQFDNALTMTDELSSFALLAHGDDESLRADAVEKFYSRWQAEDLVLDKWFATQATADNTQTLANVRKLMQHEKFSKTNPNKVRALIGSFTQANVAQFHQLSGEGYAFLTEMILMVDAYNPQIAARLAQPFSRWQRFDKKRQALMQNELMKLSKAVLSNDVAEVVSKSLDDA